MEDYLYQIREDVSSIKESISWISGIFIGAFICFILFSGNSNKIIDYSRICNDAGVLQNMNMFDPLSVSQAVTKCSKWNNLSSNTYIINETSQSVIEQDSMIKESSCVVVDNKNWQCPIFSGDFGFENGKYFNTVELLPTQHFGRYTYWWYKFINWTHLDQS